MSQDIIKEIEKAADEYANDKIESAGIKTGAQFILPLLKKAIEQRDKWTQVAQLDLKIISESENAELLKLLKDKQNE